VAGVVLSTLPARAQYGVVLSGVGPVNQAMGGAAVAAPLDALGTLHWNPAAISGLPHSEVAFGAGLLYPQTRLSSAVAAGALGPAGPPVPLSGADRSDSGVTPLPSAGFVYHLEDSVWSYGLGFYAVGGFSVNYPASRTNPILTPQPPNGLGLGAIDAELQVLQLDPTVSCQLTPHLAVGFASTVDLALLSADPDFLAAPDDANGDGFRTYPAANHTRYAWGLGFQLGLYYTTDSCWSFGASFKSPQWFEPFRSQSADERGFPRTVKVHFDYPMIVSVGGAYTGFERWTLAADLRFVDYHNTQGFSHTGFDPSGAVRGLGWDSIFTLAVGAQYQLTDALALRLGYTYNMNPIDDDKTLFNVASPTIIEHTLYLGASYQVTHALALSLTYAHAFENSIQGPIVSPVFGPLRGTSVRSEVAADAVLVGASVAF
jgi:long-chain fatty acid transport protein